MNSVQNPNLDKVEHAVEQLGNLANDMVFSGGSATGMLITDPAAPPVRVTRDIDVIMQVDSLDEYEQVAEKLRAQGFKESSNGGSPVSRWLADDVSLDVMSTDPRIMGFGNQWFAPAMTHAESVKLPSERKIKRVSAPYFLMTKLEAFSNFGSGDYLRSPDIEDMIAVIDGRQEIVKEVKKIKKTDPALAKELSKRFRELLKDNQFVESVSAYMPTIETSHDRVMVILQRIVEIAKLHK